MRRKEKGRWRARESLKLEAGGRPAGCSHGALCMIDRGRGAFQLIVYEYVTYTRSVFVLSS